LQGRPETTVTARRKNTTPPPRIGPASEEDAPASRRGFRRYAAGSAGIARRANHDATAVRSANGLGSAVTMA
jgi:hypothetical protein